MTVASRSKPLKDRWSGVNGSDCEGRAEPSSSGGEGRPGNGAVLARRESLKGGLNPMSVVRGNPDRDGLRSKPSRPLKRRGRNEAAGNAAARASLLVREWTQPS
jgi:hypothetical protein